MTKKKLDKKARIGFSETFNDIESDQEKNAREAQQAFNDVLDELNEYYAFVIKEIATLQKLEIKSNKPRDQEFRNKIIALGDVVIAITKDLDETRKIRAERQTKIEVNRNYDPKFEIERLKLRFINVSHQVEIIEQIYKNIDTSKAKKFADQSNTMLNRSLDKFVTFINKLKAVFGFSDSMKQSILRDLKSVRQKNHKDMDLGKLGLN